MKILHVGDMHLGKSVDGYNLIDDQKYVLNQITAMDFDTIILAGDIYDRAIPPREAIALFDCFINDLLDRNKRIVIISGNHDSSDRLGFLCRPLAQSNIFIKTELEANLEPVVIDDVNFYLIPFKTLYEFKHFYGIDFPDTNAAYKYVIDNRALKAGYNMLVMHDYVTAGMDIELSDSERPITIGGSDFIDYHILEEFDYVALGHIHGPQRIGSDKIRYAGSIMKYSFSEIKHKKSCCLIDTKNNDIQLIPLKMMRDMVEIEGYIDEVTNIDFYTKYNYKNDYFKIILKDDFVLDAQNRLKSIYQNLMEISFIRKTDNSTAMIHEIKNHNFKDLFVEFYKKVSGLDIEEDNASIVENLLMEVIPNDN